MINPLKITVITPGIDARSAGYEGIGIPGPVMAEFLMEKRIIHAKDDLYSLFFLLTPGDTKAGLDTLLNTFLEFEQYYNKDAPLEKVLPKLTKVYGDRHKGYTLKQLCQEMHSYYRGNRTFALQQELFAKPNMRNYPVTLEHVDYLSMENENGLVNLDDVKGRIATEGVLPYPPDVFIVVPGEKWSNIDQKCFEALVGAIERFPGFVPEIQDVYWNQKAGGKVRVQAEVLKGN